MKSDNRYSESSLDCVRITKEAFYKINMYSQLVSSIANKDIEVAGALLGFANRYDQIVTDAAIFKRQEVTSFKGLFKKSSVSEFYANAKQDGKKILGMWHSHGEHPVFHSLKDDSHLCNLLIKNTFFLENNIIDKGKKIPFVYSVVINNDSYQKYNSLVDVQKNRDYYCCLGLNVNGKNEIMEDLELILVDETNNVKTDVFGLLKDVCLNVSFNETSLQKYLLENFKLSEGVNLIEVIEPETIVLNNKTVLQKMWKTMANWW